MLRSKGYTRREVMNRLIGRFAVHAIKKSAEPLGLLEWGRKYLPHYYTHAPSKMHKWLAKQFNCFDKRGQRVAAIGPRGGAKSVIGNTTLILQRALEGRESVILISSDTVTQAKDHLRSIKDELETNEDILRDYPAASGQGPVWRENMIQMNNGVMIRALGTLTKIRGMRRKQTRPSLVVCDDPENDDHISSTAMRDRTRRWFGRTLMSMGNSNTNYVALGTALHREGLINHIMALPGWRTYRIDGRRSPFKSIIRWPTNMHLWDVWENIYYDVDDPKHLKRAREHFAKYRKDMLEGADVLWPEYEPLIYLMKLRAQIGHQAFESEKQGNPLNLDTIEWPEEYFQDIWFREWPTRDMIRIVSLDPSKGRDAKRGDYSAIGKVGVTAEGMYYVEADLQRRSTDVLISDTVRTLRTFGATEFAVEVNQYQSLLADEILREMEHHHVFSNVHPLDNRVKKEVRIRRLSPLLAQKRIKFKAQSKGTTLLVQQLKDFPNGDHDDGPDMLEMATRIAATILEATRPADTLSDLENIELAYD